MTRKRLLPALVVLPTIVFLGALSAKLAADTVYLKNGSWIDGIVRTHTKDTILLEIGDVGKIEIPLDDVYRIEKNSRTGSAKRVSVEGRAISVDEATEEGDASGAKPTGAADEESAGDEEDDDDEDEVDEDDDGAGDKGDGDDESASKHKDEIDPKLRDEITQLVHDLTREKPKHRVRAERRLKAIGAPAVPFLLPLATHESEAVRIATFRLFSEVGDESVIDVSIAALTDSNEFVRDHAHRTLQRLTKEDFGYKPFASPRVRESRAARWRRWWEAEKQAIEALRADR